MVLCRIGTKYAKTLGVKVALPSRSLGLLMIIGFTDLILTAWLHYQGLIVELNPIMRVLIERSEWLFAVVKGGTLAIAWIVMSRYAKTNRVFVRNACLTSAAAYLFIWTTWFLAGL